MSLDMNITTTAGEVFHHADSARMAALVYRRFGRDLVVARGAWQRLMENNTGLAQFKKLVVYGLALERLEEMQVEGQDKGLDSPIVQGTIDWLMIEIAKEILS